MAEATIQELTDVELDAIWLLLGEIESGPRFSASDPQHVDLLKRKVTARRAFGIRYFGCHDQTGEVLGVVGILLEEKLHGAPSAEVTDIGVLPPLRRCGLGTRLLAYAVQWAREHGAFAVYARTYACSTGTIAFYGRNAFYPVAVIPGANGPTDEGDVVMRRLLCSVTDGGSNL